MAYTPRAALFFKHRLEARAREGGPVFVVRDGYTMLARLSDIPAEYGGIPREELVAYANLFAAAPELLEALEELLAHAAFIGIAPHYDQLARAAIAKARGRE